MNIDNIKDIVIQETKKHIAKKKKKCWRIRTTENLKLLNQLSLKAN